MAFLIFRHCWLIVVVIVGPCVAFQWEGARNLDVVCGGDQISSPCSICERSNQDQRIYINKNIHFSYKIVNTKINKILYEFF
jgi:hypothetical protein